jgi:YHS domain-containing protein
MNNTLAQEEHKPQYKTACGGRLIDPTGYDSAIYRGERIYFCKRACLRAFEQNPDPFIAGKIEHPIHENE